MYTSNYRNYVLDVIALTAASLAEVVDNVVCCCAVLGSVAISQATIFAQKGASFNFSDMNSTRSGSISSDCSSTDSSTSTVSKRSEQDLGLSTEVKEESEVKAEKIHGGPST